MAMPRSYTILLLLVAMFVFSAVAQSSAASPQANAAPSTSPPAVTPSAVSSPPSPSPSSISETPSQAPAPEPSNSASVSNGFAAAGSVVVGLAAAVLIA